jgi:hypothetical protein
MRSICVARMACAHAFGRGLDERAVGPRSRGTCRKPCRLTSTASCSTRWWLCCVLLCCSVLWCAVLCCVVLSLARPSPACRPAPWVCLRRSSHAPGWLARRRTRRLTAAASPCAAAPRSAGPQRGRATRLAASASGCARRSRRRWRRKCRRPGRWRARGCCSRWTSTPWTRMRAAPHTHTTLLPALDC